MSARAVCTVGAGIVTLALTLSGCSSSGAGHPAAPPSDPASGTTSAPSATPSPTATPLSAYEDDPAIRAYRAWSVQAARTVNSGHYTSAALAKLMSARYAKKMKLILGDEVGKYYPGPIPFQPTGLISTDAAHRQSPGCILVNGFAQNPKTHKPAKAYKTQSVEAYMTQENGRWVVDGLVSNPKGSCSGVKIATPTW